MKAHNGSSFGPDALKAITKAFDEAWAEIEGHIADDPLIEEGARQTLASAILSIATDSSRNVEVLKRAGLRAMARNYGSLPIISQVSVPHIKEGNAILSDTL
jgi:hypothetical protein